MSYGASTKSAKLETNAAELTYQGESKVFVLHNFLKPLELADVLRAAFPAIGDEPIAGVYETGGGGAFTLSEICADPYLLQQPADIYTELDLEFALNGAASDSAGVEDAGDNDDDQFDQQEQYKQYDYPPTASYTAVVPPEYTPADPVASSSAPPLVPSSEEFYVHEVEIRFKDQAKKIGLVPGLQPGELSRMLHSIFPQSRQGVIAGFLRSDGTFVNVEDVCNNPYALRELTVEMAITEPADEAPVLATDANTAPPEDELHITESEAVAIRKLIHRRDPAVLEAYGAFPDIQKLVDAFIRLARYSVRMMSAKDAAGASAGPASSSGTAYRSTDWSYISEQLGVDLTAPDSKYSTVLNLHAGGLLSEEEAVIIVLMLKEEHPLVIGAHVAYDVNNDEEDFVHTLRRIVQQVKGKIAERQGLTSIREVPEEADEPVDEEPDDLPPSSSSLDVETVHLVVAQLFKHDIIGKEEHDALQSLIDDGDPLIQSAWSAYVYNKDLEDLVDSLLRVLNMRADQLYQKLRQEEQELLGLGASADRDDEEEEEEAEEAEEAEEEDDDDDEEEEEDYTLSSAGSSDTLTGATPPRAIGVVAELFGVDENTTLKLFKDLAAEERISPEDMVRTIHHINTEEPTMLAAVDAYLKSEDRDWDDFVDNVHRIVRHTKSKQAAAQEEDEEEDEEETTGQSAKDEDEEAKKGDGDLDTDMNTFFKIAVAILKKEGLDISPITYEILTTLITSANPDVWNAYFKLQDTGDQKTFAATILSAILEKYNLVIAQEKTMREALEVQDAQEEADAQAQQGNDDDVDQAADGEEELKCVVLLQKEGVLDNEEAEYLAGLIEQGDPALIGAFALFRENEDWADLHRTIRQILGARKETSKDIDWDQFRDVYAQCVDELCEESAITTEQAGDLISFFSNKHGFVKAALNVFADDPDTEELKETLVLLVQQQSQQQEDED